MIFSVEIPDSYTQALHLDGPQPSRRALEVFALEGYRSGELSRGQVSELLNLEVNETMRFLQDHACPSGITFEEFEREAKGLREFLAR